MTTQPVHGLPGVGLAGKRSELVRPNAHTPSALRGGRAGERPPTIPWTPRLHLIDGGDVILHMGQQAAELFNLNAALPAVRAAAEAALYRLEFGYIVRHEGSRTIRFEVRSPANGVPGTTKNGSQPPACLSAVDLVLLKRDVIHVLAASSLKKDVMRSMKSSSPASRARIIAYVRQILGVEAQADREHDGVGSDRASVARFSLEQLDPAAYDVRPMLRFHPRRPTECREVTLAAVDVAMFEQAEVLKRQRSSVGIALGQAGLSFT